MFNIIQDDSERTDGLKKNAMSKVIAINKLSFLQIVHKHGEFQLRKKVLSFEDDVIQMTPLRRNTEFQALPERAVCVRHIRLESSRIARLISSLSS